MRVIAGEFRSRVLEAPKGMQTRPTSDRLRETLFNVLSAGTLGVGLEGARFVDLYAGCGAVGIEAISRGADFVWFAENAPPAVAAIRANLAALKIAGGYALEDRGVGKLLESMAAKERKADILFLDPPYEDDEAYAFALQFLARKSAAMLSDEAVVIAEHARKRAPAETYAAKGGGSLVRARLLEQGDWGLSFYRRA